MPADLDNTRPQTDASAEYQPELGSSDPIGAHGDSDREGAMAKADLYKLANYSHKLYQQLSDQDQLESWVQAKITKAADYIASVYHYLEYEMKFTEYAHHLDNSDTLSEGQKMKIKELLAEAKDKMKDLKKTQAEKVKEKKIEEGILSGGERPCSECGGTGMMYEEPKAIPDHVKSKVEKYNKQAKAFHAASKRLDKNHNGIPDDEEVSEDFDSLKKTGDSTKTHKGNTVTKTEKGLKHERPSSTYDDGGDELDSIAKSGKGVKSHAKAKDSATKKAEKGNDIKLPKHTGNTWGMKGGEKFGKKEESTDQGVYEAKKKGDGNLANNAKPYDKITRGDVIAGRLGKDEKGGKNNKSLNEDGHPGYPVDPNTPCSSCKTPYKKHFRFDEQGNILSTTIRGWCGMPQDFGVKEGVAEGGKPSAGLSKEKKSAVVKKAKAGGDIGKPGKGFDKLAKKAGGGEKGEKIAAAAMWKNMKETVAYMAEKKAATKNLPGNQEKIDVNKNGKIDGDDLAKLRAKKETVNESSELTRMQEQMARLNRNEKPALVENREVDQIRALTKRLLG